MWIAGADVLHRFSYTAVVTCDRPSSPAPYFIVLPDEGGAVWITASNGENASAFYRVAGGVISARPFPAGVSSFGYRAPDKTLWFGGEGGLWRMAGDALTKVELPTDLANQGRRLQSMTHDRSGAMWVAFNNFGLYRLKDGEWTRYRSPGQARGHNVRKPEWRSHFTDTCGRVLLSCADARMAIVDGERERSFGAEDGIEVGNVTALAERGHGIWIGGEFGLQHFDREPLSYHQGDRRRSASRNRRNRRDGQWGSLAEWPGRNRPHPPGRDPRERVQRARLTSVSVERFDQTGSGVPGLPTQLRHLPTAIEGTDGRLWFALYNGGRVARSR